MLRCVGYELPTHLQSKLGAKGFEVRRWSGCC